MSNLTSAWKRHIVAARLDAQGQLVWANSFDASTTPFSPTFWVPLADGGAFLQVTNASNIRYFYRIGPDGKLGSSWSASDYSTRQIDVISSPAGGFWQVSGPMMTTSTPASDAIGGVTTASILGGAGQWSQYRAATGAADGGLIGAATLGAELFFFKTDSVLGLEWKSAPVQPKFQVNRLLELPNCEGFLASGFRGDHFVVAKIGCDGTVALPAEYADLSLSMEKMAVFTSVGQSFSNALTIKNSGLTTAKGIVVELDSGNSLTLQSASPTAGTWGWFGWTLGSLAAGDSARLNLVAKASAINQTSFLRAQVAASPTFDLDSQPGNVWLGEDDEASFFVFQTSATGELAAAKHLFSIASNPASGAFFIENLAEKGPKPLVFSLFDSKGQLLKTEKLALKKTEIRRDGLPSGLYFFKIEDEKGQLLEAGRVVFQN